MWHLKLRFVFFCLLALLFLESEPSNLLNAIEHQELFFLAILHNVILTAINIRPNN